MVKNKFLFLAGFLLLAAGAVQAQSPRKGLTDEEFARGMAEESMRSGRYSQDRVQNWDGRLKAVSGTVSVKTASGSEWSQVTEEMPLESGDFIRTATDGTAELYLDDKGAFFIGRNTELEVSSLEQSNTSFSLAFGSLVAKVRQLLSEKFKMQVRTPTAVCAVRGTEFAVEYSRLGKDTGVAVFDEGRLAVTPVDEAGAPGTEQLLEKNTELSLVPSQKRFRPVPLARMARHRGQVAALRTTVKLRLKAWKRLAPSDRAELRDRALKRRVLHRQLTSKERPPAKGRGLKADPGGKAKAARKNRSRKKQAQ